MLRVLRSKCTLRNRLDPGQVRGRLCEYATGTTDISLPILKIRINAPDGAHGSPSPASPSERNDRRR